MFTDNFTFSTEVVFDVTIDAVDVDFGEIRVFIAGDAGELAGGEECAVCEGVFGAGLVGIVD